MCLKLFGKGSFPCLFSLSAASETNPVHYSIIFKVFKIAHQALSSTQPAYLNSMLTVWNLLPASIKLEGNIVSFRWCLKTYLLNAAYPPLLPSTFIHPSTTCALFTITRLISFCRATELDLWCIRLYYYYYYYTRFRSILFSVV